ncbi:MAG: LysM peptidoglycan-binding domain-containing protein [Clostridia bacterium]|nr:LysM peptidoglycan-binding domain-containing protein [Clostridia bacterium]
MDLYLTEKDTGWKQSFCLLPDEIKAKTTGNFISYNFINRGEVKMPNGQKLCTYSWKGAFLGESQKNLPFVKTHLYHTPKEMIACIEKWRTNHTKLVLMLTETPINVTVYLKSFDYTPTGGVGNYDYSIEFIEAKDVTVQTVTEAKTTSSSNSSNTSSGTRAASATTDTTTNTEQTKTYTVKKGDCLWSIAKAYLGSGSKYTEIYELNKSVIGSNPNLIYAGQVLVLPY